MPGDAVALFGLQAADPTIPWPARGSAETALCERPGWERRTIPVLDAGCPSTMEAMCRGELAVNRMLGGDEGFAVCLAASGFRLSCGGRVFARCADAMAAAEAMMQAAAGWCDVPASGYGPVRGEAIRRVMEAAERRGEIMLDRVFPT